MSKLGSREYYASFVLSLLISASCSFDGSNSGASDGSIETPDASAMPDGGQSDASDVDAKVGQPDGMPGDCIGEEIPFPLLNVGSCDPEKPTGPLELNGSGVTYQWDTQSGNITNSSNSDVVTVPFTIVSKTNSPDLYVASVTRFVLGSNSEVIIVGPNAFVLLSTSSIEISGVLLADANGAISGPGGNHSDSCSTGRGANGVTQTDGNGLSGGSGGGGGAFRAASGSGAPIDNAQNAPESAGGTGFNETVVPLNGGCAGGAGGNSGGAGGGGGGAVQLIAKEKLSLASNGVISTSGGGGQGASVGSAGGGGGGSGGAVLIQASSVEYGGVITRNGGGGGEGTRSGAGNPSHGEDGYLYSLGYARGAFGGSSGGDGGDGASVNYVADGGTVGFSSGVVSAGGGGGGGSLGRIIIQTNP